LKTVIRKSFSRIALLVLVCICLSAGKGTHAWEVLADGIDLSCSQTDELLLACSYRLLSPGKVMTISAQFADQSPDITTHTTYPAADSVTAVLLLVDTSDPDRNNVVRKNIGQIIKIIESADTRHRIGLASFDSELRIHAPVGESRNRLIEQAEMLEATGMTTELYRSTLRAIEQLANINADRKVIFMFSDGLAEDVAYFHHDVVSAARRSGVIINSLGFARSAALSVALQTLRRLSDETGGIFIEAESNHNLPESFLDNPYENIDRGGYFVVDLNGISRRGTENPEIIASFETTAGPLTVTVPVSFPNIPEPALPVVNGNVTMDQPMAAFAQPATTESDWWLWYSILAILFTLVLCSLAAVFFLYRRQTPATSSYLAPGPRQEPFAYLIRQGDYSALYPVTRQKWRIGRGKENEMALNDGSVSRRHAELHRLENGKFVLYDCGSTNGVFVNNRKVSKQTLFEGDLIEIGDAVLRFTLHPMDYQAGAETETIKTRMSAV